MSILNPGIPSYTWATKPTVANWPKFNPIFITDVGASGSLWHNDGTYWVPVCGSVSLASSCGSAATPLVSMTGTTGALFTIPGGNTVIPANMIIVQRTQLVIEALLRRVGTNGTSIWVGYVGTSGTSADSGILVSGVPASNDGDFRASLIGQFPSSGVMTINGEPTNTNNANYTSDKNSYMNTAAAMQITLGVLSANALDTFQLISYSVELRF
ncbi:MAG: hypothetical protein ACYC9J_00430 [Sulfuricaulis sp.]